MTSQQQQAEEYKQWREDAKAQEEYQEYLLEEELKNVQVFNTLLAEKINQLFGVKK